ncbi:DJ-1/PfpI family protein [Tenacibaculum caenipelagi]|uniref:DJ-1/PfpI family protein n=1 Tax=Tenacibaculum caenipelagi TaxID=1325435 RepID=A0A4R6TC21_9FLAO|nr:DJ-1/PfpI family protein [Tenacibaculum caenipelagi]TDQ24019.1 DJ-1/PfpI family protein [Tenacibaculum caenipelagi]
MKNLKIITITLLATILVSCNSEKPKEDTKSTAKMVSENQIETNTDPLASCSPRILERNAESGLILLTETQKTKLSEKLKKLNPDLPIVGLLMYDDVLTTELTAPMDVFTKLTKEGKQLFNVITIAETYDFIVSEEGLKMFPDYTLENAPKLDILIVPSAYDMSLQVKNKNLVDFIKSQNNNTEYTVSNCAGATLIGESGIADGKKIVTWIGGGEDLQKNYPNLKVQDDGNISYMEDGKFLSSNGNLASYISSLELLEKLSSKEHREFVESYLYLDRLQNWKK